MDRHFGHHIGHHDGSRTLGHREGGRRRRRGKGKGKRRNERITKRRRTGVESRPTIFARVPRCLPESVPGASRGTGQGNLFRPRMRNLFRPQQAGRQAGRQTSQV